MLGFPLGILSAAGAAVGVAGSYDLLETEILAGTASGVSFTSLATYASDYKHLQIRWVARGTRAASGDNLGVRFNGVTTSSYSHHRLTGNGSSVISQNGASATFMLGDSITASTSTANAFAAGVIDILDPFSTTKNKTIRVLNGKPDTSPLVQLVSGAFYSTDSVTSIGIFALTGNLASGTRMSLYGLKG